jgi:hypothetical protein
MRNYERSGVTVDQCSECRGIFLDRGELERLIDAETAYHAGAPVAAVRDDRGHSRDRRHDDDDDHRHGSYGQGYPKRRRSFLGELFD